MKINMTFDIEAKCYEFLNKKDLLNIENYRTAPIETSIFSFDIYQASYFLFKFMPSKFNYDKYIVILKYDDNHCLNGIEMINRTNNHVLVVINFKDFIQDIYESFIRIRSLEKISSLLEFDFEDSKKEDNDGIIDEFDLAEENSEKE